MSLALRRCQTFVLSCSNAGVSRPRSAPRATVSQRTREVCGQPRSLSASKMKLVSPAIRRGFDPDSPVWTEPQRNQLVSDANAGLRAWPTDRVYLSDIILCYSNHLDP